MAPSPDRESPAAVATIVTRSGPGPDEPFWRRFLEERKLACCQRFGVADSQTDGCLAPLASRHVLRSVGVQAREGVHVVIIGDRSIAEVPFLFVS